MDFISREISGNVKFWKQLYFSEQVPELLSRAKCVEAEGSFCQNFGKSSQKVAKTGRKSKKVKLWSLQKKVCSRPSWDAPREGAAG